MKRMSHHLLAHASQVGLCARVCCLLVAQAAQYPGLVALVCDRRAIQGCDPVRQLLDLGLGVGGRGRGVRVCSGEG